jgi:parvulin-like peptidyl-prolyl isomerase
LGRLEACVRPSVRGAAVRLFAVVALVATAGCDGLSSGTAGRDASSSPVVARVDGVAITRDELDELSQMLASRRPGRPEPDRDDALEAWIQSRLLHEELRARGLQDDADYRSRLEAVRARAWRSEQELARSSLVAALEAGLAISDEELRSRYEDSEQRFLTTRLHLRLISVPDRDTILGVRKQLAEGAAFEDLARQANLDPALRQKGGDLGWLEQRKLPTGLIGPAHRLVDPGQVSEPFRDREGRWNLVQLVAREKAARRSFDAVRDQLERELRVVRSREALAALLDARRASLSVERLPGFGD